MKLKTLFKTQSSSDDQWIATADIMATLMLVFAMLSLFVITNFGRGVSKDIKLIETDIYSALMNEFRLEERMNWGAQIDETNGTVTFSGTIIQFKHGSAEISEEFKSILSEFFPRYIETVRKFKNKIQEIDVEGHTNSKSLKTGEEAYNFNMNLSQRRAYNVLTFCRQTISSRMGIRNTNYFNKLDNKWTKNVMRAVGYSSSKPICKNGELICDQVNENFSASRRVQFRIRIDNDVLIEQIRDLKNKTFKTGY